MSRPVILTGIRANNDLHIGNYYGALLPIIDMAKNNADDFTINLFVPDLHSFTTPIDHTTLQQQIIHNLKIFIASGLPLDHQNIFVYRQSYIPAHSELAWILSCFTGFGEMKRMTQFKDKSDQIDTNDNTEESSHRTSVGLFNYPILMSADILLYDAELVPVGDDQSQHLEFARNIAQRFNNQFGEIFTIPMPVAKQHEFFGKDQGLRIRDLINPTKKMSKSDEGGRGVIFLGDSPEDAQKKIMAATTDSNTDGIKFDYASRPGISNLLQMLALLDNVSLNDTVSRWTGKQNYGELKSEVSEKMKTFLTEFHNKLSSVNEQSLFNYLQKCETEMNSIASAKLLKVQQAIGLRP